MDSKKTKKSLFPGEIKLKIKHLISEKVDNITKFSTDLGYSKGFITSILSKSDKFFNLEHIEKICKALNYSVAKLFEDDINSQEKKATPASGQEAVLLEIYRGLSPDHQLDVISLAGERRLAEMPPPKASKKESAAQ